MGFIQIVGCFTFAIGSTNVNPYDAVGRALRWWWSSLAGWHWRDWAQVTGHTMVLSHSFLPVFFCFPFCALPCPPLSCLGYGYLACSMQCGCVRTVLQSFSASSGSLHFSILDLAPWVSPWRTNEVTLLRRLGMCVGYRRLSQQRYYYPLFEQSTHPSFELYHTAPYPIPCSFSSESENNGFITLPVVQFGYNQAGTRIDIERDVVDEMAHMISITLS